MSPSRTSPPSGQTEINTKDKGGGHQSPGIIGVRTPPVPSAPVVDPDLRNHRPGRVKCSFWDHTLGFKGYFFSFERQSLLGQGLLSARAHPVFSRAKYCADHTLGFKEYFFPLKSEICLAKDP